MHRGLAASQYAVLKTVTDWSNFLNCLAYLTNFEIFNHQVSRYFERDRERERERQRERERERERERDTHTHLLSTHC